MFRNAENKYLARHRCQGLGPALLKNIPAHFSAPGHVAAGSSDIRNKLPAFSCPQNLLSSPARNILVISCLERIRRDGKVGTLVL